MDSILNYTSRSYGKLVAKALDENPDADWVFRAPEQALPNGLPALRAVTWVRVKDLARCACPDSTPGAMMRALQPWVCYDTIHTKIHPGTGLKLAGRQGWAALYTDKIGAGL